MIDTVRGGLLERERELAMFDSALDGTGRGIGSLVLIDGPAGIGKTRLLAAARTRAAERGLAAFTARGSDLERDFAFGVVRQLFGNVVARERESVLAGVATYVASIFGQHPRGDELGQAPSASALQHALFWLVANLAERAPLLLAVDDAHWADEPSLRFLHYMARRVEEVPVTMVLVIRAESADMRSEMVSRIAAEPAAVLMSLHALTVSAAKTLVRLLVSPDVDERLCEACYAATGGNPLLLSELARALVETGLPAAAQDIRGVERLVPRAVARHVLVRLARQPPSATALAQAVAVLGSGVEPRHAAALAGLDESAAAEAIDSLVAADILAPERPLGFLHPLLREVIYAELAPGKRAMTHRRAARLLADAGAEPQRTASQLLACEPVGADWAVHVLRTAARDAQARGSAETAVTYLSRALDEPPAADQRAAVLLELGVAEDSAALPKASEHLTMALADTREAGDHARIAAELAVSLEHEGRPADAAVVLQQAIDALKGRSPALRTSLEAQAIVVANTFLEARRALDDRADLLGAELPTAIPHDAGPLLAAVAHEMSRRGGTAEQTVACAERSLASGLGMVSLWDGVVVIVVAEALARCDRLTRAEAVLDRLLSVARGRGATHIEGAALTARAVVHNRAGRLREAEADARLALALGEHVPHDVLRPYKLAQLAAALIEQGELESVERLMTPSELARHEADQSYFQTLLRDTYGRFIAMRGRLDEALEELGKVERAELEWDIRNPGWTTWRPVAALIHDRLGHHDRAAELAEDELRAARAFGAPSALGGALCTTGLLNAKSGIDLLREAVAVLEHSEARLEHARSLIELGTVLRRAGHRAHAREPLRTGLEIAYACSAQSLAERARQELLATGARARHPHSSGRDALTASELRITRMAAEGLSNREIAQALYLSLKTVEMHLGHAYDKLGIHSRGRIAAAFERSESTGR